MLVQCLGITAIWGLFARCTGDIWWFLQSLDGNNLLCEGETILAYDEFRMAKATVKDQSSVPRMDAFAS